MSDIIQKALCGCRCLHAELLRVTGWFLSQYTHHPKESNLELLRSLSKHLFKKVLSVSGRKTYLWETREAIVGFCFKLEPSAFKLSPLFLLVSVVLNTADPHLSMWQKLACEVVMLLQNTTAHSTAHQTLNQSGI